MKLALVGVGAAGTRIVDRIVRAERTTGRAITDGNVLVYDTAGDAFADATAVPPDRRVLLGDAHPAVVRSGDAGAPNSETDAPAASETDAAAGSATRLGVGGDPDAGATVARADLPEIRRALDSIDETAVAATMVVAGLGGGTGSGVGSVVLDELRSAHESPVYALGVLPAATESDERALTAARGVRTIVPLADAVFPVDNEAWRRSDRVSDDYAQINDRVATRILALFGTGEGSAGAEVRVDPADVQRTLAVGGLAAIGRQTMAVDATGDGWLARLWRLLGVGTEPSAVDAGTIKSLVRRALESELTVPCSVASADRVLLLLSGPPSTISRKGFETGRYLLEEETATVEVLAGDESRPGATEVTATVVLANVTDVPPVERLQARATDRLEATADETDSATRAASTGSESAGNESTAEFEFSAGTEDA